VRATSQPVLPTSSGFQVPPSRVAGTTAPFRGNLNYRSWYFLQATLCARREKRKGNAIDLVDSGQFDLTISGA
jgi:hypothetical protein